MSARNDVADTISHWFYRKGPHGNSDFKWTRSGIYSSIDHLHRAIGEIAADNAGFPEGARRIALHALESDNPAHVRRGIQVLAVVGMEADYPAVKSLLEHTDTHVAADARCFFFERGIKPESVL
jgi:hypothetical protein